MAYTAKRRKRGRILIDLPSDVLQIIFELLTRLDVIRLSQVNREFRLHLAPYIFEHAKATWAQIIDIPKNRGTCLIAKYIAFIRAIRISNANSYNEYQQSTFGSLLAPAVLPGLSAVTVNSGNLSYWLKYNKCDHIRSLSLYSDSQQINSIKIFHLSHISGFHGLRLLLLSKYHFNWIEEEEALNSAVALEGLTLHDCTWEYPFDLNCFNCNGSLRELTITYTNDNPFILLERFVGFLENPFSDHSGSLRNLRIQYFGFTCNKKILTPQIFEKLLHHFHGIEELVLQGWNANLSYLRPLINNHHFQFATTINLAIECLGEMTVQDFESGLLNVANLRLVVNRV